MDTMNRASEGRTPRIALGVAAAAVLASALGLWLALRAAPQVPVVTAGPWQAGTTLRYRLAWTTSGRVALTGAPDGEPPLANDVDLAATLRLTGHAAPGGEVVLAASLDELARHDVAVLGRDVFADHADATRQLVGPTAWVTLKDGVVAQIHFEPGAPPVFKHLMQSVLGLAQVRVSAEPSWSALEPGPSGIARVIYERTGARTLVRRRVSYERLTAAPDAPGARPELAATAAIELDADGRIASLVDDERLVIRTAGTAAPLFEGRSRFTLELEGRGRAAAAPVPVLAGLEARRPAEPVVEGDVERALLEQRAAGLTFDELARGVRTRWSDRDAQRRWFARGVALLRLDPSLCAELAELGFGDAGDPAARRLVFDLLAAAGHADAQAVMREALGRDSARPQLVELVQRFSRVTRPDAASARFVHAAHARARASGERALVGATSYTLGALAHHLRASGEPALAAELDGELRAALAAATTSEARATALAALGNARLDDNVALVRAHAGDPEPDVRGRAAWALRHTHTDAARDALYELATDADPRVARTAFAAL